MNDSTDKVLEDLLEYLTNRVGFEHFHSEDCAILNCWPCNCGIETIERNINEHRKRYEAIKKDAEEIHTK